MTFFYRGAIQQALAKWVERRTLPDRGTVARCLRDLATATCLCEWWWSLCGGGGGGGGGRASVRTAFTPSWPPKESLRSFLDQMFWNGRSKFESLSTVRNYHSQCYCSLPGTHNPRRIGKDGTSSLINKALTQLGSHKTVAWGSRALLGRGSQPRGRFLAVSGSP